jgi:hypothetical protein
MLFFFVGEHPQARRQKASGQKPLDNNILQKESKLPLCDIYVFKTNVRWNLEQEFQRCSAAQQAYSYLHNSLF